MNVTEEFLATALSIYNAADMLQLADIYSAKHLRTFVEQFIVTHGKAVVESEGYKSIRPELQEEINELSERRKQSCCKRKNSMERYNWCMIM